jgi:hypothetical protein
MNPNYAAWKSRVALREQEAAAAAAAADAAQALADAATAQSTANTAQSTANTAQSTANTGVSDAADAQETADEALVTAEGVAQAFGQDQVTGGVSPTPYIVPVNGGTQAEIRLGPGLTADAILYRVYTGPPSGSFGGYSGAFSIGPGDTVEAYTTTTGLTDSPVATYDN